MKTHTPRYSLPRGPLDDYRRDLVEKNLALASWWVEKTLPGIPRHVAEEARAAAVDGLIRAAQAFDPGRGFKFVTYATRWIRGKLQDWRLARKRRPETCYLSELGFDRDRDELGRCWLEEGRSDPDQGPRLDAQACRGLVSEREWFVVWNRYAMGRTLKQIGSDLGVTKERIRQVCLDAKRKLRGRMPGMVEAD
jgi:RNA polymerase sigma factor (sigma-70 family)